MVGDTDPSLNALSLSENRMAITEFGFQTSIGRQLSRQHFQWAGCYGERFYGGSWPAGGAVEDAPELRLLLK